MKNWYFSILILGMCMLLTGCGETKLTCSHETGDFGGSTIFTFYYDDLEDEKPKKIDEVTYYYNVEDVNIEQLQEQQCPSSINKCIVEETRDGYQVEKTYDIHESDVTVYGSYDDTKTMLETTGWSCE